MQQLGRTACAIRATLLGGPGKPPTREMFENLGLKTVIPANFRKIQSPPGCQLFYILKTRFFILQTARVFPVYNLWPQNRDCVNQKMSNNQQESNQCTCGSQIASILLCFCPTVNQQHRKIEQIITKCGKESKFHASFCVESNRNFASNPAAILR